MDLIERLAKTVDEAKREALDILKASEDDVIITVLDEGAKGVFGIGSRPAKVRVERKPDPDQACVNFIIKTCELMGLNVLIDTVPRERFFNVNIKGDNMGILIGKRGQTLDALQYITNLAVGRHGPLAKNVVIDTENYRKRRRETLESLARTMSRRVRDTRTQIKLEPMSRFERHIIHTVLQHDKYVRTFSEGNEPFRYVVICQK